MSVSGSMQAELISKNEDIKNNTIGKGNTRGRNKRVKKVAGIAGDDSEPNYSQISMEGRKVDGIIGRLNMMMFGRSSSQLLVMFIKMICLE